MMKIMSPICYWLCLMLAIVAEVAATAALRASAGFTRFWPSVIVVLGYAVAFGLLARIVHVLPVGVVYAIWSGVGMVLISLVGYVVYAQRLDGPAAFGIALIVAGVVVIQLFSRSEGS